MAKRLITTDKVIYDQTGAWLGREVIEVDGFTAGELKSQQIGRASCRERV